MRAEIIIPSERTGLMVISHRHRYLFVELPYTGSTAIAAELCEQYAGTRILYKHAKYVEFTRRATTDEKSYFVFSCIRNPLDEAVSHYFRYKTNHDQMFTDKFKIAHYGITRKELAFYEWIRDANPTFPQFLVRAYRIPHDNWSAQSHHEFDAIIRFENLQADFGKVLERLGIETLRPLPVRNKTADKSNEYLMYYTPAVIPHARRIFGPFMRGWGYHFPREWGEFRPLRRDELEFQVWRRLRLLYWRHANRTANPTVQSIASRLKEMV